MASRTTTRSARRAPRPAKKPSGTRPSSSRRRPPPPEPPRHDFAAAARRQLGAHRNDAIGVALLVLAALTALGLASDLAGTLGRGLADTLGALLGQARYGVPVACVVFAVLCLRARPHPPADPDPAEGPTDEEQPPGREPAPLRVGLGTVLLGLAVVGVLHLTRGAPALDGPVAALRAAGGYLGA
ncbi:MAG TPA: hypothetical protein VIJ44_01695, partial [Acidimicrobiia bacterium]